MLTEAIPPAPRASRYPWPVDGSNLAVSRGATGPRWQCMVGVCRASGSIATANPRADDGATQHSIATKFHGEFGRARRAVSHDASMRMWIALVIAAWPLIMWFRRYIRQRRESSMRQGEGATV
jgi:hypothetical protein